MPGIYIHIPFCRKACIYCDFHFSTKLDRKGEMVEALGRELQLRQTYLDTREIKSVYFGGGTPSVLTADELSRIFEAIEENFEILPGAEVTFEANPDDLTEEKLRQLADSPVNRLSIGIQSFDEEDLSFMNRSHDARQALDCVENARRSGFENLTIDLIYGVPGRSEDHWRKQVEQALRLDVPHLSAYALTVEKETILENWIRKGKVEPVDDELAMKHFLILTEMLGAAGYEHYEISNFAKPGFRAVHNSSYWSGEAYLGLGPSAHSFNGDSRQWNVANNHLYLSSIQADEVPAEKEILSQADQFNEMVMTSLRRMEGLDLTEVDHRFGVDFTAYLLREAVPLLEKGKLEKRDQRLLIPPRFRFYSDGIASSLFYI